MRGSDLEASLVLGIASELSGYHVADIVGKSRMRELVEWRHAAMIVLAKTKTVNTLCRLFDRDHTVVYRALGRTRRGSARLTAAASKAREIMAGVSP